MIPVTKSTADEAIITFFILALKEPAGFEGLHSAFSIMQSMHQPCLLSFRAEEPHPEDEKRKNYGGVYVGLPTDLSSVTTVQTPSTHKGTRDGNQLCRTSKASH
uniref:Uncharacterized protein n=1 Tax=Pygocentrus nattereri TaxID=42514 RepID=A0A3B4EF46_PYGNA